MTTVPRNSAKTMTPIFKKSMASRGCSDFHAKYMFIKILTMPFKIRSVKLTKPIFRMNPAIPYITTAISSIGTGSFDSRAVAAA